MSARERLVVRILLLVARICAGDDALAVEIKHLANHIDLHGPKESLAAVVDRQQEALRDGATVIERMANGASRRECSPELDRFIAAVTTVGVITVSTEAWGSESGRSNRTGRDEPVAPASVDAGVGLPRRNE